MIRLLHGSVLRHKFPPGPQGPGEAILIWGLLWTVFLTVGERRCSVRYSMYSGN